MINRDIHKLIKTLQYRLTNDPVKRGLYLLNKERPRAFRTGNQIQCKELNLTLDPDKFLLILPVYERMIELRERTGAEFRLENDVLVAHMSGLNLEVTIAEDVYILWEIYCNGSYNYQSSAAKPCVVIDIGMNVGFASLFYSLNKSVSKIYSFEPFLPTYKQALRNIERNKSLSGKIVTHQFGLGRNEENLVVNYAPHQRGRVGIYGTSLIRGEVHSTTEENIEIRKASTVLRDIIQAHGDESAVEYLAKIDTEGSEYGILQDLHEQGILRKLNVVVMEWHEQGPSALLEWLTDSGFNCFHIDNTVKTGMIYAIRR